MDNLEKLEQRRQELLKEYAKEQKKAILFLVGGLLFGLAYLIGQEIIFLLPGIIFVIIAIVFFGKAASHAQKFRTIIKQDLIIELLKDTFEDVRYEPSNFISIQTINNTGMVKRPDRYHGEDYIAGTYKGVKFQVSDVDLKERVETRDSKGNVHVSYQTYFKGRWYIYQFERHFDDMLKIVEGRGWQASTRSLVKVETESMEFNKKFAVFASNQEFGFYHITSSMIEKFLTLEKLHRGSILYYLAGNELHVGVNDRRDYMELSLKTPLNQEALKDFMVDIDLIPAIINELRLDTQKFKNQG
ncbi:MAG: DUF3137 domain-containing protein [Acholeplasma sp.]|jgi:hypothetical protein|nr:MAG: DUF3137 domain-containing protein [Acholeplasma sp.]